MPIANLYPAQKGIFLTVIGGFFDSSSTVLMIYQLIFDGGIARLFWISMTYAGLSCFLMVRTLFMVPIRKFNLFELTASVRVFRV